MQRLTARKVSLTRLCMCTAESESGKVRPSAYREELVLADLGITAWRSVLMKKRMQHIAYRFVRCEQAGDRGRTFVPSTMGSDFPRAPHIPHLCTRVPYAAVATPDNSAYVQAPQ